MKKVISLILTLMMFVSLFTACGTAAPAETEAPAAGEADLRVAVIQQLDHSSLDEIRTAAVAQLEARAAAEGMTIEVKTCNGQNDMTVLNQIATEVMADGYDLLIPIATNAALSIVNVAGGTDVPVVFSAISDPVGAGLMGFENVTGVSDALNTQFIMDMMFAAQPDIQTVGLLYSNSEPNSVAPIAEAIAYLESKGIAYLEKSGNTPGEIVEAASSLVGRVDAVFTPTDNAVMAAAVAVAEILNADGIPHYAGADSFVTSGAFATCGVNYTDLGTQTADLSFDILMGGDISGDFFVADGGIITVNTDTANACGVDYSVFSGMATTVIEVTSAG